MVSSIEQAEALNSLHKQLHGQLWYAGLVLPNPNLNGSIVAYVNRMNKEVFEAVPKEVYGFDVKVHFITAETAKQEITKLTNIFVSQNLEPKIKSFIGAAKEIDKIDSGLDIHHEIWKLKRICGINALTDIFFEVHDKDDAITNVSERYADVRSKLEELYVDFGFDVLYDELEIK